MFISQMCSGNQKLILVSAVAEKQIIYIPKKNYKTYEKGLTVPEGIELRNTFFTRFSSV